MSSRNYSTASPADSLEYCLRWGEKQPDGTVSLKCCPASRDRDGLGHGAEWDRIWGVLYCDTCDPAAVREFNEAVAGWDLVLTRVADYEDRLFPIPDGEPDGRIKVVSDYETGAMRGMKLLSENWRNPNNRARLKRKWFSHLAWKAWEAEQVFVALVEEPDEEARARKVRNLGRAAKKKGGEYASIEAPNGTYVIASALIKGSNVVQDFAAVLADMVSGVPDPAPMSAIGRTLAALGIIRYRPIHASRGWDFADAKEDAETKDAEQEAAGTEGGTSKPSGARGGAPAPATDEDGRHDLIAAHTTGARLDRALLEQEATKRGFTVEPNYCRDWKCIGCWTVKGDFDSVRHDPTLVAQYWHKMLDLTEAMGLRLARNREDFIDRALDWLRKKRYFAAAARAA